MTLLLAYTRERLTVGRLLPFVLLVVVAALTGRGWPGTATIATDMAAAFGLVVAFRVWDDLMDRERDRVRHRDRVLVRVSSTVTLQVAAWIMAAVAAVLLGQTRGFASVVFLAGYAAVLTTSYVTLGRSSRSAARDRILLLKYGVFTLALIGLPAASSARALVSAAAAFVAASVYEWWHDAESPVLSFGGSR
jgi:4-hydroxybenzoate polyprenyltransferase